MSQKYMLDLIVVEKAFLNNQHFLLKLSSKSDLPELIPGQFAELRVDNSAKAFLRRPVSINFVDRELNQIWFLIQIKGEGTLQLSKIQIGDQLNVLFPLGNTFSLPDATSPKVLLIGGGVGAAPLLYWSYWLKSQNVNCTILIGARSKEHLLQVCEFERFGHVITTTEDGSDGEKGFVTDHSILKSTDFDAIYTCGPTPMMKAVARYATAKNIFCEVSLENTMACGIGACLCCVTDSIDGNICVCTEGPVFNITKLKW